MPSRIFKFPAIALSLLALAASVSAAEPEAASPEAAPASVLRVCSASNAAPFSTPDGMGFEDRVAAVVAEAMGRSAEPYRLDKPAIYLVRDALDKKACDVVVGLDSGDERVLTTKPYYRSGYVFITRADRHLDVSSWKDPRILGMSHIAVGFNTPGEAMLKRIGKYDGNVSYVFSLVGFKSPRNQYVQVDPAKMVGEVAAGHADMAVAFAPEVARYVKASSVPLRMTLVADDAEPEDGRKIEQQYSQSMGVRKGDTALLAELDAALVKARPRIREILEKEGIPLLPTDK